VGCWPPPSSRCFVVAGALYDYSERRAHGTARDSCREYMTDVRNPPSVSPEGPPGPPVHRGPVHASTEHAPDATPASSGRNSHCFGGDRDPLSGRLRRGIDSADHDSLARSPPSPKAIRCDGRRGDRQARAQAQFLSLPGYARASASGGDLRSDVRLHQAVERRHRPVCGGGQVLAIIETPGSGPAARPVHRHAGAGEVSTGPDQGAGNPLGGHGQRQRGDGRRVRSEVQAAQAAVAAVGASQATSAACKPCNRTSRSPRLFPGIVTARNVRRGCLRSGRRRV